LTDASARWLFQQLKEACADEWRAYTHHAFVRGLGDGSLPETCFRHYLTQDYLFLVHFARAYGLAAFKAESLEDVRAAAGGLAAIVDREMALHVSYCEEWGLSEAAMAASAEAQETIAYTRYVLERGLAGDLLDLQVALAPCIIGYAEIGRALAGSGSARATGNRYQRWIETYAHPDYQETAAAHARHMDRLMDRRGGAGRLASLITTFRQATRLETAFWEMGLKAAEAVIRPPASPTTT
jgi:thiaminase/transcriptional activator TenA